MKRTSLLSFTAILCLAIRVSAQSLPPVVERYEQLLVRSPGKGTAFDKVYQHFFEGEGLEKLAARWTTQADAPGTDGATYWLLLGVLAERQGKAPEAIRLYQKAAGIRPADARVWSALGDAQAAAGNFPEAIKALQKALASNPARDLRPQVFRQLARSQQRAFDGEGALKTWQQFVAESPDDPFVIEEAADAMAEAERFAEAKAHYEKLRDLAGTDPYRRVTAIMKLAQLEERQGRREEARALYESALPLASPASWMHREVRARIEESYRRQDDLPGLTAYYEAWLKKEAKDVDAALRLSDALIELNRKTEAVTWLRQASEWAPDRKEVQVALAKRLGEIDQPREAVTILTKLTQAHPEEESFREFLGDAHWQVFKTAKDEAAKRAAIESWRQLAPTATKDANKVSRVADLFRARELAAEALEHYARAVNLAPDVPELRQRWAEYLFELKRDEEGAQVLREMVAGERATAPNFLRLARLLERRHDLAGAQDSVEKGLAKEPANFELLSLQWRIFSETEKWEQAAGLFERLLAAAPSVYSVDQVEDQQVQALRGLGRLEEVSKQLAGRIGKEPALTEAELRLLLRIALQGGDLETAGEALADAKQRFPASAPLVRRQVEYEKRKGNLEGRVAALQRLVELQPKQKIEWLREIVRAYQDEGLWDNALAAAQRVIEEAPASPDSHILASDLNFAAQRFEAGVAKLRDAIKLSDKPNDLRLRLARAFLEAGRGEEARQTFDAVFEAENDPKTRLSLTRQLAEVYLQQGKLDELIGRFRQRQRAEEGGWRYALYLAEIFQQMQDFTAAREELSKALGARSRDGNFLRQLMRLSEAEGNTMESARFARLLAEAEPSEAHQIDLAEALLDNGDAEEALKVLRANEEGFLKNPIAWREVLLKFHGAGAGAALSEALRTSLERHAGDWRGRLTLAEMQLGLGDGAGAERWLWEILAMPPEAAAPAPPSATTVVSVNPGAYYAGGMSYPGVRSGASSKYLQRMSRSYVVRQSLAQIFAGQSGGMRRGRFNYSRGYTPGGAAFQPALGSLEEARDAAIVYLATLAQQQDRGEAFLGELEKRMAGKSRAERLVTYGLVQARELLQREIELEAAQPSGDAELDVYCLQVLIGMAQREGRQSGVESRELALIESFLQRERRPQEMLSVKMTYYHVLTQAGLARDPLATMRQGEDYPRQRALEALRTFKKLDAYRAELEKQLAEAPSSVRTVYLLAEAHGREDSAKALGYYRKLVEIKPTDTTFQLQLATLLVSNKQPEEAMRIWEALLARDPEPVMQNAFSQLVETYTNSKDMVRLGAALLKLPKRPASLANMAMYGGGQDYSHYFNQVAVVLQREGRTAEAIQVWRVAMAEADERRSGNQSSVLAPLVSALIEVRDNAGAAAEIERFFFPEAKPKPLFGFESVLPARSWLQISSIGNGKGDMPALGLLRLARQAGSLDRLRIKAVASAAGGNESDAQLTLLIDAQRRDAATLEDFATRARGAMQHAIERRDAMSLQVLQCLAQELREWPDGRRLALELMVGVQKGFDRPQNDGSAVQFGPSAAELALELGENEIARSVLRKWQATVQKQIVNNSYGYDYRQQIPVMDLMARAGLPDEARALLKTVKAAPQWKNDTEARRRFEEFENRLALLAGETGRARIAVWAVPPSVKDAPTVICWEIGPALKARTNNSQGRGLSVSGEELPVLDGRYELAIFHGPTPSAMQKLATLPAAKARGTWTSPKPLAAGYVLAEAREKSTVLFSSPSYVATGPNLLTNAQLRPDSDARPKQAGANRPAVPGWPGLGADAFVVHRGGPRPGGDYVALQPLNRSGRETIAAQRIPLEPGKDYLFMGWLRYSANAGSAQLLGRFYDKDGNQLDQIYTNSDEADRWCQSQRWLVRSRGAGGSEQTIPAKAVEIELMIQANSGCDVDGLYFGEVIRATGLEK